MERVRSAAPICLGDRTEDKVVESVIGDERVAPASRGWRYGTLRPLLSSPI